MGGAGAAMTLSPAGNMVTPLRCNFRMRPLDSATMSALKRWYAGGRAGTSGAPGAHAGPTAARLQMSGRQRLTDQRRMGSPPRGAVLGCAWAVIYLVGYVPTCVCGAILDLISTPSAAYPYT
jgi:hypothetical protein